LAVIPDDEFIFYSHEYEYADWEDSAIRRRREARARYGWEGIPDETWQSADSSHTIRNRYFTVRHSPL
jgi:hypothetical protein